MPTLGHEIINLMMVTDYAEPIDSPRREVFRIHVDITVPSGKGADLHRALGAENFPEVKSLLSAATSRLDARALGVVAAALVAGPLRLAKDAGGAGKQD